MSTGQNRLTSLQQAFALKIGKGQLGSEPSVDEGVRSVNPMHVCRSKKMHAWLQRLLPRVTLLQQEAVCTGIGAAAAYL